MSYTPARYAFALCGLALLESVATAQNIYRCQLPGGRTVYQQETCTAGATIAVLPSSIADTGVTHAGPGAPRLDSPSYDAGRNAQMRTYRYVAPPVQVISAPPQAVERCYSDTEMRNARVGANSITLSHYERAVRLHQIGQMRPC